MIGIIALARGGGRLRTHLKLDAEIASALPPDSDARKRLLDHIDRRVEQLIREETDLTRDWPMLIFSLIVTPGLAYACVWGIQHNSWWSWMLAIVAGLLVIIFVYGIFETGTKAERNARGQRLDST